MATLAQIRKQIEQLEKHAAALLQAERAKAIDSIQRTMAEFTITLADLAAGTTGNSSQRSNATKLKAPSIAKAAIAPKYRDPKTGKTWSGRGKPPLWITKRNRDKFLIQAKSTAVKAEPSTPAAKASPAKFTKAPLKAKSPIKKKAPIVAKPKAALNKSAPDAKKTVIVKTSPPPKTTKKLAPKKPVVKSTPRSTTREAVPTDSPSTK